MTRQRNVLTFLILFLSLSVASAADMRRPKKLIATGWDHPDTQRLRQNLAEMEKRPFDGVVFVAIGQREDGKTCQLRGAFVDQPWRREWFQSCVDDLRACQFRRFTDNFVSFGANPGNVDWFDDEGWKNIVDHWRIAAWLAKQAGIRGILFDPEPYAPPHAQFRYDAQPQADQHTFDEYHAKARQRGREVMEAVAQEYPGITIFCYFMNSVTASATGRADPRPALETSHYGLYPAFVDGWLDVVPPTVTMVDGCESAYRYNSERQFLEAGLAIRGSCQELVSPENRAKYRAQVQAGFGIYLDAYWNPEDSPWYVDGLGGPRVERLRANVSSALRVADEYVWIYGEKFRWWPTPNGRVRPESWPEALPGSEEALWFARDPVEYARRQIADLDKGELVNLARNGDFGSETTKGFEGNEEKHREGGPPAGWHTWQEERSKGQLAWDRQQGAAAAGSARAAGVIGGCFIQSYPVEAGQRFAVRARRKLQGRGAAAIRVRWQTAAGSWTAESQDQFAYAEGSAGEWSEMFGVVEVPEEVGRLVILLGIHGQKSESDVAWFDDVELYKLPAAAARGKTRQR